MSQVCSALIIPFNYLIIREKIKINIIGNYFACMPEKLVLFTTGGADPNLSQICICNGLVESASTTDGGGYFFYRYSFSWSLNLIWQLSNYKYVRYFIFNQ